jgi:dTMP kinase
MRKGRFIVLDGIDGCGKSTQARLLVHALEEVGGVPVVHLREPGGSALGERLRGVLLDPAIHIDVGAEALIFAAARRQLLAECIQPALESGRDVVCERFHAATLAYQGTAGGLDGEELLELLERWCGKPRPDLYIILDTPVESAAERREARGGGRERSDRFEGRGLAFQHKVAEGFRRFAAESPAAALVDGSGSEQEVLERILAEVRRERR